MGFNLSILPKEQQFYTFFEQAGQYAHQSVTLLQELFQATDAAEIKTIGHHIIANKTQSYDTTHHLVEALCSSFITPYDREDIHALCFGLNKLPKLAFKVQEHVELFQLRSWEGDLTQLVDRLEQSADLLLGMTSQLKALKDPRDVRQSVAEVQSIEVAVDAKVSHLLLKLYNEEPDAKKFVLRHDLYQILQKMIYRQRDVANIILEINLKHA